MSDNEEFYEEEFEDEIIEVSKEYSSRGVEQFKVGDDGQMEKVEEPSIFDHIKTIAHGMDINIRDPDPNCKLCYGKGYTGLNTEDKSPIACKCIFSEPETIQEKISQHQANNMIVKNRKVRREMEKNFRKKMKTGSNVTPPKKKRRKKKK